MNGHTETGSEIQGQSLQIMAYGNTIDELEMDALDKARSFFGADRPLEIIRDFRVYSVEAFSARQIITEAAGRGYYARLRVRVPD